MYNQIIINETLIRKTENEIKDLEDILKVIAVDGTQVMYNTMYELLTIKRIKLKELLK